MGQVWAARLRGARGFHKLVAIRALSRPRGDEAHQEQQLLDEARIAAQIQHSNVVQTLELGEHSGTLYLVMEWVDGEPLSDLIATADHAGGIPLLVAVNLIGQTLRGLQAAHELSDSSGAPLGVVHREVSPDNVLVTYSGVAKLANFGITRAQPGSGRAPNSAEINRKMAYLAPEQIRGGRIDQRTDLFSVGLLLYQLTTGRYPFKDDGADGVPRAIAGEELAIRPSHLMPTYPRTLEAVVLKALEKDRDRRWPSAEEMRLALERGVPQAFGLGFETQLRNFMSDLVGIRALRKREALHRAELAADAYARHGVTSDSVPAPSAGSLRAFLIEPEQEDAPLAGAASPPKYRMPTLRSLRELGRGRLLRWRVPAVVASLAVAFVLALWLRAAGTGAPSAASPSAGMVEWPSPSAVPTTKVVAMPSVLPSATRASSPASASAAAASASAVPAASAGQSAHRARKRR